MSAPRPPAPAPAPAPGGAGPSDLDRETKLKLAAFVCSLAWVDNHVAPEERQFIRYLVQRLGLSTLDQSTVAGWLATPPPADAADPSKVPPALRRRFVEEAERIAVADRKLDPAEKAAVLKLREALLGKKP